MAPCSQRLTDARLTLPDPYLDPTAPEAPPRCHSLLEQERVGRAPTGTPQLQSLGEASELLAAHLALGPL